MLANKEKKKLPIPLPVLLASAFVLVFCLMFNNLVFERIPHVHDEIAYLFQAKIFASGRLYAPSPCARESFDFPHIVNNGRWYSVYPPGFPFLLLLGLLIKAPWLVNPLLATLSIILFYFLGREVYDRRTGIWTALLGATSIWFLLMSSTMMSHTASMFFNALFLFFAFRSLRTPTITNGFLAGASLGLAFLVRPYNALFFALPLVLILAIGLFREPKKRLRNAVAFAGIMALFASVLLAYNFLTNGHPLKMGYVALYGKPYTVIFGRPATLDYDYTPIYGAGQIFANLKALNSYLFGWPLSSFLAFLPLIGLMIKVPAERKKTFVLLSIFLSFIVGFYFFWGAFVFIGPRMFFDLVPVLAVLSARGILALPPLIGSNQPGIRLRALEKATAAVFALLVAFSFFVRFPRWIWPQDACWHYDKFDHNFAGTTARLHRSLQHLGLRNALVITKFLYVPMAGFPTGQWGSGFLHNDPALQSDIIYALHRENHDGKLLTCFPGRQAYLYLGTLEKGMLIPLRGKESELTAGPPITPQTPCPKGTKIIASPREFFNLYSAEFARFIDELFRERDFLSLDVPLLLELGRNFMKDGDYEKAAFCLEAGLQVENDPESRFILLNNLSTCYLKTGQNAEAGKIQRVLRKASFNYSEKEMYSVFPEKGF